MFEIFVIFLLIIILLAVFENGRELDELIKYKESLKKTTQPLEKALTDFKYYSSSLQHCCERMNYIDNQLLEINLNVRRIKDSLDETKKGDY